MSVILITGAARGIGAHLAKDLSEAGHTVFAGVRRSSGLRPLAETAGPGRIAEVELDVTDPSHAERAVAAIANHCGRLDVLINNAGTAWLSPVEVQSDRLLRETMETNFFGALRTARAALAPMRRQRGGKIINVSSLAAFHGLPAESAYCASKSALEAASQAMALEVERFGIYVTSIRPGYTATGMATSDVADDVARDTAYEPLLEHLEAMYRHAASEAESPDLVLAAVREVLESARPAPLMELGVLADAVAELRALDAAGRHEGMVEVHAMDWWRAGRESAQDGGDNETEAEAS